jgi:hypothetical protein
MGSPEPGPGSQHPEEYRRDLNPEAGAGENTGNANVGGEESLHTLADVQEAREKLKGFPKDALRQIPVVPEGERLKQGATYIDLRNGEPKEFTATGEMRATKDHWYVPKTDTDYQLWNGLLGVDNPERLGTGNQ